MASANRFALLDDEPAPKAAPVVAAAPAPAAAAKNDRPPRQNYQGNNNQGGYSGERGTFREDRGDGGRGGRGRDRPYRPRSAVGNETGARRDGEFSNPNKREYDGHFSRTDYVRGGGRGRGGRGRGGPRRPFNAVGSEAPAAGQDAESAIDALPKADADTPAAEGAEEAAPAEPEVAPEPEEVDTTITLAQFMAKKAAAAQLEADLAKAIREAGEEVVEEDFQNAKAFEQVEVDGVLGAGGAVRSKKEGGSGGNKLVEKKKLDIDFAFASPAGGRGGRGGYRGGRGGYSARQQPVNILDNRSFPALGK